MWNPHLKHSCGNPPTGHSWPVESAELWCNLRVHFEISHYRHTAQPANIKICFNSSSIIARSLLIKEISGNATKIDIKIGMNTKFLFNEK